MSKMWERVYHGHGALKGAPSVHYRHGLLLDISDTGLCMSNGGVAVYVSVREIGYWARLHGRRGDVGNELGV